MRGGTQQGFGLGIAPEGLSPRARGNQRGAAGSAGAHGTIPACAGEPDHDRAVAVDVVDYPRVRGGTGLAQADLGVGQGLSPRARGNLLSPARRRWPRGTIPACAGEPRACSGCWSGIRDYPRVRGGTAAMSTLATQAGGLSPRARGNLLGFFFCLAWVGTIPACAGEPRSCATRPTAWRDYPRVRGGTMLMTRLWCLIWGLSPRARGNL